MNTRGIIVYIRASIPSQRETSLESQNMECIPFVINLNSSKWCIFATYRPPSENVHSLLQELGKTVDVALCKYEKIMR